MEHVKIVGLCIGACVAYGIIHDLATAHLCVEYFTREHPTLVNTESPIVLALLWGVAATWWVGAIGGALLAWAARAGTRPRWTTQQLIPLILRVAITAGAAAFVMGALGYILATGFEWHRYDWTPEWATRETAPRYWAVAFAHATSYGVASLGGLGVIVYVWRQRNKQILQDNTGARRI